MTNIIKILKGLKANLEMLISSYINRLSEKDMTNQNRNNSRFPDELTAYLDAQIKPLPRNNPWMFDMVIRFETSPHLSVYVVFRHLAKGVIRYDEIKLCEHTDNGELTELASIGFFHDGGQSTGLFGSYNKRFPDYDAMASTIMNCVESDTKSGATSDIKDVSPEWLYRYRDLEQIHRLRY